MKKSEFNFLIEALMFLFLSILAGIGLLMRLSFSEHDIPTGSEELVFGMADHQWGTIHLYVGLIFLGLILTHVYLHFNAIRSMYSKLIDNPQKRKLLGTAYISICLILFFMFLIARFIGH